MYVPVCIEPKEKFVRKKRQRLLIKITTRQWDATKRPYKLGSNPISINADNSIPVDIELEEFKQAITAELLPEPLERWRHNFYETDDIKEFFFINHQLIPKSGK